MIRMLLVGCCHGVRLERRRCDEVHLNLGGRLFCRLGLEGGVPERSTLSKARHARLREAEACMAAGLVGGRASRLMLW